MPVNQTFANYSDLAFKAAFAIYIVALVMSLVYYVKQQMLIDARRESKVLVGAGGGEITGASEPQDMFEARAGAADKFGGMAQSLVWLGIIIHGTSVVLRGLSAGRFPWGNLYEYVSVTTFVALAIAAVVFQRREYRIVWPWVLTPVLALLFYGGTKLYAQSGPVVPALQSFWFPFHVSTVSIGGGIGLISGLASLMYVLRSWQPVGQEKGFFGAIAKPLPSAKTLDAIVRRFGRCRFSAWVLFWARCGLRPRGAGSGDGTPKKRCHLSRGCCTRRICMLVLHRGGGISVLRGSTCLRLRRWCSICFSSILWCRACIPTRA